MAFPTATLAYSTIAKAVTPTLMEALLARVPAPEPILEEIGCFISSDSTAAAGQVVTRTIVIKCETSSPATATARSQGGYSAGPIEDVTVTAAGRGYVRPPVCLAKEGTESNFAFIQETGLGARLAAYLKLVADPTQLAAGTGYSGSTIVGLVGGFPPGTNTITQARPGFGAVDPLLWTGTTKCGTRTSDPPANGNLNTLGCVRAVYVKQPGIGYTPATTKVVFLGDPPVAGGRAAIAFPTFDSRGRCTGITMVDSGCGYITTPKPVLVDTTRPGGRDAVLRTNMMRGKQGALTATIGEGGVISALHVADAGDGYVSVPQIVLYDPTGAGSGASYTVGPVPGSPGALSCLGVSRIDVLNRGDGYTNPHVTLLDLYAAAGLNAIAEGQQNLLINAFANLMKTALQNVVGTAIVETLS